MVGFSSAAETFSKFSIIVIFLENGHLDLVSLLIQFSRGELMILIIKVNLYLVEEHIEIISYKHFSGRLPVFDQQFFVDFLQH
jgi:hypothetical protein